MNLSDAPITVHLVDVVAGTIQPATVSVHGGENRGNHPSRGSGLRSQFLIPGFVDVHIHIESSICRPAGLPKPQSCTGLWPPFLIRMKSPMYVGLRAWS